MSTKGRRVQREGRYSKDAGSRYKSSEQTLIIIITPWEVIKCLWGEALTKGKYMKSYGLPNRDLVREQF